MERIFLCCNEPYAIVFITLDELEGSMGEANIVYFMGVYHGAFDHFIPDVVDEIDGRTITTNQEIFSL